MSNSDKKAEIVLRLTREQIFTMIKALDVAYEKANEEKFVDGCVIGHLTDIRKDFHSASFQAIQWFDKEEGDE